MLQSSPDLKAGLLAQHLGVYSCNIGILVNEINKFAHKTDLYLVLNAEERKEYLNNSKDAIDLDQLMEDAQKGVVLDAGYFLAKYDGIERHLEGGLYAYLVESYEVNTKSTETSLKLFKVSAQIERRVVMDVTVEVRAEDCYAAESIARDTYIDGKIPVVHDTSFYWGDDAEFVVEHVEELHNVE